MSHTPGPWAAIDLTIKGNYARVVDTLSGQTIANVVDDPCLLRPSPVAQANARLIALAPEMSALLAKMAKYDCDGLGDEARALLARVDA